MRKEDGATVRVQEKGLAGCDIETYAIKSRSQLNIQDNVF